MNSVLSVAKEFSTTPGARYPHEAKFSGEEFRTKFLAPRLRDAIREGKKLVVDLDGTSGYGVAFLDEVFGGLLRAEGFDANSVYLHLSLKTEEEPYLRDDIINILDENERFKRKSEPISSIEDLTEEERDRIVFNIMHYNPTPRVRDRILEEALKFKWTDSEQMGLDIYQALPPEEQLIAAGFEWRRKHWQDFFEAEDTDGQDQPRKI